MLLKLGQIRHVVAKVKKISNFAHKQRQKLDSFS